MTCENVSAQVPSAFFDSEGNYIETGYQYNDTVNPASSSFLVEGRNIGKDQGYLDEEIPSDHPSYRTAGETWGDRCPICVIHPKYDLTIRLDATSTAFQDTLHMGGFRLAGESNERTLTIMRSWNTRLSDKNVTINARCTHGESQIFQTTVTATITGKTRTN